MSSSLYVLPRAQKELDDIRGKLFERLSEAVMLLAKNPRPHGVKKMSADEGFRVRVGDFRVLYRIDDAAKKIFVYRVKHRKEVYR